MRSDPNLKGLNSESLYAHPESRAHLRESARRDGTWEVGAIPLPSSIETDPDARPVVTMVVTRNCVLALDMLTTLSGEADAVAAALHRVLEDAMRLTGARPRFLNVVYPEEAAELALLLDGSGIEVEALGTFDRLHDPARAMVEDISGTEIWPPMSAPDTWSAWGLPDADVAALFRAAAEFFRAAPWTVLSDGMPLAIQPREGSPRGASVMGQGGEVFGLAVYPEAENLVAFLETVSFGDEGLDPMDALRGRSITLLFDNAHELPRPMRREVARKGWPVASPSAYPTLVALNTPGGGVARSDLRMLSEALTLIPEYLDARERADADGVPLPRWTSPDTGTEVYELFGPESSDPPPVLEPGYARGPEARPGTFLALEEDADASAPEGSVREAYAAGIDIVNDFGSSLHRQGLTEPTIMTHVRNAAEFVYFLVVVEGVALNGLHERDLRSFLLDWHPLHTEGGRTRARRMPVSLDRFFRFLEREVGIECPWAAAVLDDRDLIETRLETAPAGDLLDLEVRMWRDPVLDDMEYRLLRPHMGEVPPPLSEEDSIRAINRLRELTRTWLVWRDELIESGEDDGDRLWDLLVERQRAWVKKRRR